ncbi:tetratricopeptide repeat protein [Leptospira weilii serovar Ranarum str. ICFT]|uniref:Tetratricopeptide repeat protein n=1 Tax=Leptospira weilii serovar Ranarum str. ICFT TaxID=1218598 RepID=N1WFL1_9LEPT|nr:tetratricopeptide repeat protein [Leptospira weilii]EMY77750.1 tetratricopeptide repeat protein [Leptospira weilii serovar Ranarum str. ICFT]
MSFSRKLEEANQYLSDGDFDKAKKIFDSLLAESPEHPDSIAGYFIASYWDNRLDRIHNTKEGRERSHLLVQYFSEFQNAFDLRKFTGVSSFHAVSESVLSEAVDQLKISVQREGLHFQDPSALLGLIRELIRFRDYRNALEILNYSSSVEKNSPEFLYLRAESLFQTGEERRALVLFREAFLKDPSAAPLAVLKSEPIFFWIEKLKDSYREESDLKEVLPVVLTERGIFEETGNYSEKDILGYYQNLIRLKDTLNSRKDLYDFKIRCRILQHACFLLDVYKGMQYGEIYQESKKILDSVDPGFFQRRQEEIKR